MKELVYLLNQKNLSGRQARWLEKIAIFDYNIEYVSGSGNVLANALSWIYAVDSADSLQSQCEYTYFDVVDDNSDGVIATQLAVVAICTRCIDTLSAESGCAKTLREFATRMRGCFWL